MNDEQQDLSYYDLQISVRIQPSLHGGGYCGDGLTVSETVVVKAADFMEACKIVGQFHDLADRVKVVKVSK